MKSKPITDKEEMRTSWSEGKAATGLASNSISVYPNPLKNELQIKSVTSLARIEIYSIDGKLKKQATLNGLNYTLIVNDLDAACYIVKTYDALGKTAFARVVKTE